MTFSFERKFIIRIKYYSFFLLYLCLNLIPKQTILLIKSSSFYTVIVYH